MISFRKSDLIDRLKSEGEVKFHLTLDCDVDHEGHNIYFITTDTGGGDWSKCSDVFQREVECILDEREFLYGDYGEWKKYLPTPLHVGELTHIIDRFLDELLAKLKRQGFYASITMEGSVTNASLQADLLITKRNSQYKKADLIDRIKSDGVIDLVFEKGYSLESRPGYDAYTFDCSNGRDIPGASLIPPITGHVNNNNHIIGCFHTKLVNQLLAWSYEVVGIKYYDDKQQIIFKVKKKS